MSMTIGSYGNNNYVSSYDSPYARGISSGKRINKAADDAAGMAIAKKLEKEVSSLSKATNNAYDMKNLTNVAGGALNNISDSIGRIREIAVQASNGIYTSSDRQGMQEEVNQLLDNIDSIAKNTEFNTMKLLDGSFTNKNAQITTSGSGMDVSISSSLTDSLGISGFDVTSGNVDLSKLDNALEKVSSSSANLGAVSNRLDSTIRYNDIAYYNQEVARSRIEDQDIAKGMMEINRNKALEQYNISMQKQKMQNAGMMISLIA